MYVKKLFLILFISPLFLFTTEINAQNIYQKLTASRCDSLINANTNNPNFVILDLRTPVVWAADHLKESINRNYYDSDFQDQLNALPKHKTFLIHCQSGGRSGQAFNMMQSLDFAEVYDLSGGMNSWKRGLFSTTSELAPKLMLVNYTDSLPGTNNSDTINITLTNRANETLTFSTVDFDDFHEITNNFENDIKLEGAEDYTFSIFHNPAYSEDDSTTVTIESNGGRLELNIVYKNGIIQTTETKFKEIEITIYPNPASNRLSFQGSSISFIENVSFINLSGQIVLNKYNISAFSPIDVSDLKNGIYIARIEINNKIILKKIVIKK